MDYPVIIVGGGPVGLTMALALSQQGISSAVIEKHPHTTNHPKARGVNGRSMEIFRQLSLAESLNQYRLPREAHRFIWFEDFHGDEMTRVEATVDYNLYSPTAPSIIAQDCVEKELYIKAENDPAIDLKFNHLVIDAQQSADSVSVSVESRETGEVSTLMAKYLVGADGAYSTVRDIANIKMEGVDSLGEFCNIYCEMDLDKYIQQRPSVGYMFTREDILGTFILAKEGFKRWLVGVKLNEFPHMMKDKFTDDDYCLSFVKNVIQDPDVEVKLINKGFWTMAALIAETYQKGRFFLVGDAAHRLPPTGGFGMNTGIQDAHNLAWKLAYVLNGVANEQLLSTYESERQPIAETNIMWSSKNAQRFQTIYTALAENDLETFKEALHDQTNHINNIKFDLGFVYGEDYSTNLQFESKAVLGGRAPHCCLSKAGQEYSTLDFFIDQFTLFCSPQAEHWLSVFSKQDQLPLQIITIGDAGDYQDKHHEFQKRYGISPLGAALVRPDGHIAWLGQDSESAFDYQL